MDFSVLEPHLFRNAQLYAPEDLGRCDLLIAGEKSSQSKKRATQQRGQTVLKAISPERWFVRGLSISMYT